MTECTICVESYNKSTRAPITCTKCELVCCKVCFKRYISDPEHYLRCMSCAVEFDRSSLHTRLGQTFMRTIYRDIRESVLYEQEKALFPATQEVIEHRLQIRKLRKQIDGLDDEYDRIRKERTVPLKEFRYCEDTMKVSDALDKYFQLQLNIESVDEQLHEARRSLNTEIENLESGSGGKIKRTYVLACTKTDCKGMLSSENVNKQGQYICSICDSLTCNNCKMGISETSHECDPDVLKTVEYMESTSKPCPSCGIPIHQISGCFAVGTIIPLADGTNVLANEIQAGHQLIGDDGSDRTVLSTITGTDQLYRIDQSNGCSYEVNTYHMLCLMRADHNIIIMTLNVYLDLSKEEQKKLFGYKIVNENVLLSELRITPTRIGRYYGFMLSDNQRFVLQDGTVAHNCSQMFCTGCHASFDWNTLRLNNGAVHNPYHAAWLRENRGRVREVGDIQCGRELDIDIAVRLAHSFEDCTSAAGLNTEQLTHSALETNYLFEAIRIGIHHTHVTLPALARNRHGHHTNQNIRINLLTKVINEFEFKREIQRRDKSASRRNDYLHIVQTYRDSLTDIIWPFVENVRSHRSIEYANWIIMINEIHSLETYIDECFVRVAETYNSTNPYEIMDDRAIR